MLAMLGLVSFLGLAIVVASLVNERFRVTIRGGRVERVRGRVPAVLLDVIGGIAHDARIEHATIRATRDLRGVRLLVSGVDDRVAQQLRNACGVFVRQR
jgi:hypothetical protein